MFALRSLSQTSTMGAEEPARIILSRSKSMKSVKSLITNVRRRGKSCEQEDDDERGAQPIAANNETAGSADSEEAFYNLTRVGSLVRLTDVRDDDQNDADSNDDEADNDDGCRSIFSSSSALSSSSEGSTIFPSTWNSVMYEVNDMISGGDAGELHSLETFSDDNTETFSDDETIDSDDDHCSIETEHSVVTERRSTTSPSSPNAAADTIPVERVLSETSLLGSQYGLEITEKDHKKKTLKAVPVIKPTSSLLNMFSNKKTKSTKSLEETDSSAAGYDHASKGGHSAVAGTRSNLTGIIPIALAKIGEKEKENELERKAELKRQQDAEKAEKAAVKALEEVQKRKLEEEEAAAKAAAQERKRKEEQEKAAAQKALEEKAAAKKAAALERKRKEEQEKAAAEAAAEEQKRKEAETRAAQAEVLKAAKEQRKDEERKQKQEAKAKEEEERRVAALAEAEAKRVQAEALKVAKEERRAAALAEAEAKRIKAETLKAEKKQRKEQEKQRKAELKRSAAEKKAKEEEERRAAAVAEAEAKRVQAETLKVAKEERRAAALAEAEAKRIEAETLKAAKKQREEAERLRKAELEQSIAEKKAKEEEERRAAALAEAEAKRIKAEALKAAALAEAEANHIEAEALKAAKEQRKQEEREQKQEKKDQARQAKIQEKERKKQAKRDKALAAAEARRQAAEAKRTAADETKNEITASKASVDMYSVAVPDTRDDDPSNLTEKNTGGDEQVDGAPPPSRKDAPSSPTSLFDSLAPASVNSTAAMMLTSLIGTPFLSRANEEHDATKSEEAPVASTPNAVLDTPPMGNDVKAYSVSEKEIHSDPFLQLVSGIHVGLFGSQKDATKNAVRYSDSQPTLQEDTEVKGTDVAEEGTSSPLQETNQDFVKSKTGAAKKLIKAGLMAGAFARTRSREQKKVNQTQEKQNAARKVKSQKQTKNVSNKAVHSTTRVPSQPHNVEITGEIESSGNKNQALPLPNIVDNKAVVYQSFNNDPENCLNMYKFMSSLELPVNSEHVLLKVQASTVSFSDCLIRQGLWWGSGEVCLPATPGVDVVGRVCSLNQNVIGKYGIATGDYVAALIRCGGNARYVKVHASSLVKVPKSVDPAAAACMVETYLSAFQSLHVGDGHSMRYGTDCFVGKKILIVGGISMVGQAMIELALLAGASTIYATARQKHHRFLEGIGASPLPIGIDEWLPVVSGQVDIAIDAYCIDHANRTAAALKPNGKLVCVRSKPAKGEQDPIWQAMTAAWAVQFNSQSIYTYDLFESWEGNLHLCKNDLAHLFEMLKNGKVKPPIANCIPLTRVPQTHKLFEARRVQGFFVCKPWLK